MLFEEGRRAAEQEASLKAELEEHFPTQEENPKDGEYDRLPILKSALEGILKKAEAGIQNVAITSMRSRTLQEIQQIAEEALRE